MTGTRPCWADADLAIIGASPEVYRSYLEQVRAEYAWVHDASWRAGRSRLLDDFLGRPRLYVTEPAFVTLEEPARQNLRWERASLG
ncbi:MAG: hypothetical protein M3Q48_00850 [Actinomycetota bacterium]|nr:hypothetical protein [Actinomycetota bacterium]